LFNVEFNEEFWSRLDVIEKELDSLNLPEDSELKKFVKGTVANMRAIFNSFSSLDSEDEDFTKRFL